MKKLVSTSPFLLVMLVALSIVLVPGCSSGHSQTPKGTADIDVEIDEGPGGVDGYQAQAEAIANAAGAGAVERPRVPAYDDPRWPTTSSTFTAMPEEVRWYNAWNMVGNYCTIVGPVHDVYQATEEAGRPIFVHIGNAYPDCVSLVIWEDAWGDFSRMISDVDMNDNSWLSVSGYLSEYNGNLQFNIADGELTYEWWTNVG